MTNSCGSRSALLVKASIGAADEYISLYNSVAS